MSTLFAVVFNRSNSKNKSGLYKVNIRVTVNRQRSYLSIEGFPKLKKQDWKGERVKISHPHAHVLNKLIKTAIDKLEGHIYKYLMDRGEEMNMKQIVEFHRGGYSNFEFLPFAEKYIRTNKEWKHGTKKSYNVTTMNLALFRKVITLKMFDRAFVEDFISFLISKKMGGETIRKHRTKLQLLYSEACKIEKLTPDTLLFKGLKIPKWEPHPEPLSKAEIKLLTDIELDGRRAYIRDVFLFMCYTGLYLSDIKLLTTEHIEKFDDKLFLTNGRYKNNNVYVIPLWLDQEQLELLNIYRPKKGFIFPNLISNDKFNKYLTEIATLAKVDTHTTNRTARYTFTTDKIDRGFPKPFISKMLGHNDEGSIEHYYSKSSKMVLQNIDQFLERPVIHQI